MARRSQHRITSGLLLLAGLPTNVLGAAALSGGMIENRGQLTECVRYYASCGEANVYFTTSGVVFNFPASHHAVRMRFAGSRTPVELEPLGQRPTRLHFFTGSQPSRWRVDLRVFSELVYRDLWPGLEIRFRFGCDELYYRVTGAAGCKRTAARLEFEGIDRTVARSGGLTELRIPGVILTDSRGSADGSERTLSWATLLTSVHPVIATDNPGTLAWSTLLGGADNEYAHGLAVDSEDRPVVTGYTHSFDFPTTVGAYDSTHGGSYDAFVAKLDATGSTLVWGAFLGGAGEDRPFAVALDRAGNVVVTGHTFSADFPMTEGAYDRILNGSRDAFVSKLGANGSALLWSTYLGGASFERGWSLALDADDRPWVAGETGSVDFPTTPDAFDTTRGGSLDAFVTQIDSDGLGVLWSTFLGGSSSDLVLALVLDPFQRPIIVGQTLSGDFPTTLAAFDRSYNGEWDCFVTQFEPGGRSLASSTFLGGAGSDVGYGVCSNAQGEIVVAGTTRSSDFPVTPGSFDAFYNGEGDAFVAELDTSCTTLQWSTFVGGSATEEAFALILDHSGRAIVSGETGSLDFPTTSSGFDRTYGGNLDAYVVQLDEAGQSLRWSTYLGGTQWDSGWDFALGTDGNPLLTGPTRSSDFPATDGAYDRSYNGGAEDVFVARFVVQSVTDRGAEPLPDAQWSTGPNPFRESIQVRFRLDRPGPVRLSVLDAAGRRVATLTEHHGLAGIHAVSWSGLDARGRCVPAGVYWLRLEIGAQSFTRKVVHVLR